MIDRSLRRARALAKQAAGMQQAVVARKGGPIRPTADISLRQRRIHERQVGEPKIAVPPDQAAPSSPVPEPSVAAPPSLNGDPTVATPELSRTKPAVDKLQPKAHTAVLPSTDMLPGLALAGVPAIPRRVRLIPSTSKGSLLQYPLLAAIALIAAYSATAGQVLVLLFGIFALVRRLDSRYAFGAALFLLVTIPLFSAIGQSGIAQNAAIYVYELLVVGTIMAVLELRRSGRTAS